MPRRPPIGGYFELEHPPCGVEYHANAVRYQSARAAFLALLKIGKPRRVWMPWYICDSMLAPLMATNTNISRYSVNSDFGIVENLSLACEDWILYVNYFGLCGRHVEDLTHRYKSQMIIDNSQAFYQRPGTALATIYSPRKFFGVPDGGYLATPLQVKPSETRDESSFGRTEHLLKRLGGNIDAGYFEFQAAEDTLSDVSPLQMSLLTQRMLSYIDYEGIQARRRNNFRFLHNKLGPSNLLKIGSVRDEVPLCYPYLHSASPRLRSELQLCRVYCPTYWPNARLNVSSAGIEIDSCSNLLPLPIDQRYDESDMSFILDIISKTLQ